MNAPSPWTLLFEAVHSALIDEITERFPEPKPVLGMPVRQGTISIPSSEITDLVSVSVTIGGQSAFVLFGTTGGFVKRHRIDAHTLCAVVLKRASPEFERRGISPDFGASANANLKAKPFLSLRRTVWIPIQLSAESFYFALGI